MTIDVERLRDYLINYYGTAIFAGMPLAIGDVAKVQHATPEELVMIAQKEHIDLSLFEC